MSAIAKTMMLTVALGMPMVLAPTVAVGQCPIGSYEWADSWGNKICKDFGSDKTKSIEGSIDDCPTGTHRWTDSWGNAVCKSFHGKQQFYDTSEGCPIGMYEWTDVWGNAVCKKF